MADNSVRVDDSYTSETQVRSIAKDIAAQEVAKVTQGVREDFIVIFGLFASILIFLGVEIQVFKVSTRFSLLVGFSLFLLAALQSFLLLTYSIVKDKNKFSDYWKNPVIYFVTLFFAASVFCFLWATIIKPR